MDFRVVRDTREKDGHGWFFDAEVKKSGRNTLTSTVDEKLDFGDYSILGLENVIAIERKAGMAELFGNYAEKDRFERELQRMVDNKVKFKYIVVEENLSDSVLGMVPLGAKGPPGSTIIRWLLTLDIKYGVRTIWAGNAGKRVARYLFEMALNDSKKEAE